MKKTKIFGSFLLWALIFAVLYYTSLDNYLFFHITAEFFSIIIAFVIFIITWNTRRQLKNNFFLIVGQAYLFVGIIDFLHTLAYKGMGIFADGSNPATQLWIAARYFEALALLAGAYLLSKNKSLRPGAVLFGLAVIFSLVLVSIYPLAIFPTCFEAGAGLTVFKKASEYLICLLLVGAFYLLARGKDRLAPEVYYYTGASIIVTVFAELSFTAYVSVYGFFNLLGHFFKILSFYFIYRGVVITGFKSPLNSLFREVKEKEKKLKETLREKETLLKEIHHRVKNNLNVVSSLLGLQVSEIEDEKGRAQFEDSIQRIQSVSLLHKSLYRSEDVGKTDLDAYIGDLVKRLIITSSKQPDKVELELDIEPNLKLDLDLELYIGLIVTELVSNSLKYAPDPETGNLTLSLRFGTTGENYRLEISDSGKGLEDDFDLENAESLGLRLVRILVENQLQGKLDISTSAGKTIFKIIFPR
ncbi:MAG: MASE3 domain-containing protein [bacterium]